MRSARRFRLALAAVAATMSWPLVAQTPAPPPEPLTLVNASVVDVARGEVRRGQFVVLRDGRIESIAATAPPAASATRRLDLRGRYVIPGSSTPTCTSPARRPCAPRSRAA
ncbi:MAG: hypothetical protein R2708_06420 [Vicinamibacterales bacterium]